MIAPWRALGRTSEQFAPVQNVGEGRAWLSLLDGATVENHARNSFGKLAHWVRNFIQPVESAATQNDSVEQLLKRFEPRPETDSFVSWWAREVQVYVFGRDEISKADDTDGEKFIAIRNRIISNRDTLDTLEEDFVRRYSRA